MKQIMISIFLFMSAIAFADTPRKTWSFYGNVGIGNSSKVTLSGLSMSAEDLSFFQSRGITPAFVTEGRTSHVPAFILGASRYFTNCRASLQAGLQNVNQSNYHANSFTVDALGGYNFLRADNHELFLDAGIGLYNSFNNYIYSWQGRQGDVVLEERTCELGSHDVHSLSFPVKLSYSYNIFKHSWLGVYAQARYNTASTSFCPQIVASAGIEYRFTFGKQKTVKRKQCESYEPIYVEPEVRVIRDTIILTKEKQGPSSAFFMVYFETALSSLEPEAVAILDMMMDRFAYGKDIRIRIDGHTDSGGSFESNVELSERRAYAVKEYLVSKGIPAYAIECNWYGELYPISNEYTTEGKALNRRSEITIITMQQEHFYH